MADVLRVVYNGNLALTVAEGPAYDAALAKGWSADAPATVEGEFKRATGIDDERFVAPVKAAKSRFRSDG